MDTYLEVGKLLKEADIKYGNSVIKNYSNRLTMKFGKKYLKATFSGKNRFFSKIMKCKFSKYKSHE